MPRTPRQHYTLSSTMPMLSFTVGRQTVYKVVTVLYVSSQTILLLISLPSMVCESIFQKISHKYITLTCMAIYAKTRNSLARHTMFLVSKWVLALLLRYELLVIPRRSCVTTVYLNIGAGQKS